MSDVESLVDPDRRAEQASDAAWARTEECGGIYRYPMDGGAGIQEVYVIFRPKKGPVYEVGPGREEPIRTEAQAD